MTKGKILIAEDDNDINHLIYEVLTREGYTVTQAFSGTEAKLHWNNEAFDLLLCDLMLPGMTGEELIAEIIAKQSASIIVISAKNTIMDKVDLLKLGASDYITKPFNIEELLARVEVQLRKTTTEEPVNESLSWQGLTLSTDRYNAQIDGQDIRLTAREFGILKLLISNPKKVFTKENIFSSVWGETEYIDENTVNVHMSNIRSKLNKAKPDRDYIETVWGIGFKMKS
ncbi:response regulator transcription factor [Listeria booriae]|uniref:Response regulator transcription factor n=1 Tax=Listeria booriae TaxID=1552123 RepID=A0A7X0XQ94_9LIST|nr:response regulator transcription factor [Listeria booriae]MBC1225736.1 response regulator transcription factor [Listeria booriae]MBC1778236.1 response regulator transcription factor [Listeria booriae]MBC2364148.1 response regulator transcription factor [Listeria booriae]MBC2389244.1 response regulator transcription factor [Listeria booriae]MBC6299294.1 response regulator transcription factor [Listeria booriae]